MAPTMDIQELYALPEVRQFVQRNIDQVFGDGDSDPGKDKVNEPSAPSGIRRASPSRSRTRRRRQRRRRRSTSSTFSRSRSRTRRRQRRH